VPTDHTDDHTGRRLNPPPTTPHVEQWSRTIRERLPAVRRATTWTWCTFAAFVVVVIVWPKPVPAFAAPAVLLVISVGAGLGLLTLHPYALAPHQYARWMASLPPFEPETFWGQTLQQLVSWVGAGVILVVGAFVGGWVGAVPDADVMLQQAGEWLLIVVVMSVIFGFWTRTVVRLAIMHRRGFRDGTLPPRPNTTSRTTIAVEFALVGVIGLLVQVLILGLILEAIGRAPR
jgi:hypothetical protein